MRRSIYVLFDVVAQMMVGPLSPLSNDDVAIRMFGELMSDPQQPFAKHVGDYELRRIGVVDLELCEFAVALSAMGVPVPYVVTISGSQWLASQKSAAQLPLRMEA